MSCFLITGCSKDEVTDLRSSADIIYEKATNSMENGNYRNATNYLEVLTTSFPFSNQAKQFEKENPTHPRVDYALYMRGLALFEGQHSWYHDVFDVDLTKRSPSKAQESFSVFSQLIRRYPNSIYVDNSRQRMIFLRNRLAKYENHVAQHYMERGAYVAAVNRAKFSIEQYNGAPATIESLKIIADGYRNLGMSDLAGNAESIYLANAPDSLVQTIDTEDKEPWYKIW